jgi:hypothetical protein
MAKGEITYNTAKGEMIISEYGRNVQNLVHYLKTIDDKDLRQKYAEQVINLFAIINPSNKHLAEYKEKLWNHMYRIAEYDLDLTIPEGITIHKADKIKMEAHLPYPTNVFTYRHYGKYIQDLIKKALAMEQGEKREALSQVIASYMKLAYRTWNKEHFVSDEIILQDLEDMSKGEIVFKDDFSIENLVSMKKKNLQSNQPSNNNRWDKNRKRNNNQKNKNQKNSNNKFKKR